MLEDSCNASAGNIGMIYTQNIFKAFVRSLLNWPYILFFLNKKYKNEMKYVWYEILKYVWYEILKYVWYLI